MKLTRLAIAAATAATLLLSGCSTSGETDAEGNPVNAATQNPNATILLSYTKGGSVETASPQVLDEQNLALWSLYTDEEIVAVANDVCKLMTNTVEANAASPEAVPQAFVTLFIETSKQDLELEDVVRPEDRVKRVAMFGVAAQVYCTEHKDNVVAAIKSLEAATEQLEAESQLTQIEQLNLDLGRFISIYSDPGTVIVSPDGLTLQGYIDLNGDNIIGEDEIIQSFQLPEGYSYSETIGDTPKIGDPYSAGNLNDYSNLTIVEQ